MTRPAGAEGRAGHVIGERLRNALPQSLVVREEKGAVLHDGPTHVTAKLVQAERLLRRVERVSRVHFVIAQKLKNAAMKLVRAGLRHNVHLPAGAAARFGRIERGVNAEFGDGVGADHQAQGCFRAFHIASEPVQVVRNTARKLIATAAQLDRLSRRWQQAKEERRIVRYDPGILAATPLLHGHCRRVGYCRDARESPWHDSVPIWRSDHVGA